VRTPKSATLSAVLSLVVGLLVTLGLLGYGVTEEVPIGSITGQVKMTENGKPLPNAFITISKMSHDGLGDDYADVATEHHFRTDKNGSFQLRNLFSGNYSLTVSSKAHSLERRVVFVTEGKPTSVTLEAKPKDPDLELYSSQRVSLPSENVWIQMKGFSQESAVAVSVYKLDAQKVIQEGGIFNALAPTARKDGKLTDPAIMGNAVNDFSYTIKGRDAEGSFTDRLQVPKLAEGFYWIQMTLGKITKGTWISVSKIALIVKHTDTKVTGYVTALDTGVPVANAQVGLGGKSGFSSKGTTSTNGIATFDLPPNNSERSVVMASSGGSYAMVDFVQSGSDDSGDDEEGDGGGNAQTRIYTYTDRPIYRPGDQVFYKGIVRRLVGSNYQLPKKSTVTCQVTDEDGTILDTQTLTLTPMGTFSGSYTFSQNALPANYPFVISYGSAKDTKEVGVAAYRKPTYSIKVTPEKKSYVRGDVARVAVETAYYYGAPVVGAKVTATITREPYWDWQDYGFNSADDFDPSDYEGSSPDEVYSGQSIQYQGGEQTQDITATTDSNGKAFLQFPTIGVNESSEAETDFTYTINVSVQDSGDKTFDGTGSVLVKRSNYDLSLQSDSFVTTAGQPVNMHAAVKDANGHALPGYPVKIISGFVAWTDRKEILQDMQVQNLTTNADGSLPITITPPGPGFYKVTAEITDDRGHTVDKRQEVYLEGSRSLYEQPSPASKLTVILDKRQYKEGDTAKALITCKDPGGTALVSIEGSEVYNVQTLKLNDRATVYRFKVAKDFAPDAFVAVAYVHGKRYFEDNKRLLVDLGERKLDVKVTADKAVYHPGDTAVYTVQTKTASGKPAVAEVSLGVVDESIYAIFDDHSDIVKGFYPKRGDSVQTDYSFPELYLGGGDKAPTNIQVRRKFNDTAFWQPTVTTDASGQAKVSVKLPDNLTSWRATVRAVTADTSVGQASSNVIARKDLMVELSAPTFVVNGDQQRMVAMITNNSGSAADVKLQLQSQNASVEGDSNTTVHIDNGAMQTVEYKMTPEHSGEADFTAKAWIDQGPSDGMELKVPVTPHARLVSDGFAGSVGTGDTVNLTLQSGADTNVGELSIHVSPNLATSMLGPVDALVDFPYGCVEQTTSRFLPAVIYGKGYAQMGIGKPKHADDLQRIVSDSYARLQAMQHDDGGWGWWKDDVSDPYMTAYVLEAISKAKQEGFAPPNGIHLDKALDWATKFLAAPVPQLTRDFTDQDLRRLVTNSSYLAYSVALSGKSPDAIKWLTAHDAMKMDAAQAAYAALTWSLQGPQGVAKKDEAFGRMMFLAHQTRSTLFWDEQDWYGFETTGRCFMALATLKPDDPAVTKAVAYLIQKRQGDMWYSTRDTSAILLAMADYLKHLKPEASSNAIEVSLNGTPLTGLSTVQSQDKVYKVPISQLKVGQNEVHFNGGPTAFYAVTLKQYVAEPQLEAVPAKGFTVERNYYKLESQRMEDGTLKMMPSHQPVTDYHSGDILQCQVRIHSDFGRSYILVEIPTPSGCHVTDREEPDEGESWSFWWSRTVILDDKVAMFATSMPSGDNMMTFNLRAENPGSCRALPTTAYNMYDASDGASSSEVALQVSP
jgi:uncharacterized protein YfaS (alpha-2-macroglobulin family)